MQSVIVLLFKRFIFSDKFFIFVAFVIPSSIRPVLCPFPTAQPAELVTTASIVSAAGHMIAALVLFNWFSAIRALLCIGQDPVNVLAFS